MRTLAASTTVLVLLATVARAQTTFPIHPRAAYLRTSNDSTVDPVIRTLTSLGVAPGDLIRVQVTGEITYNTSGQTTRASSAVFSATSTLLATSIQQRVPDAVDAGTDFVTGNTYHNALPTDIPQDFQIGSSAGMDHADVIVPAGAVYLFIGVADSLYNDNLDTDNDFMGVVTLLCAGGQCCDSIDFNGDTLFPDTQDVADFLTVFGGGACPTGMCNDIDFNNDGLFPDTDDIAALIRVFGGGACN